jgi:hypothetical protein
MPLKYLEYFSLHLCRSVCTLMCIISLCFVVCVASIFFTVAGAEVTIIYAKRTHDEGHVCLLLSDRGKWFVAHGARY